MEYKDSRPRDWAYKAVFSQKDLSSLQEMARRIRETHDVSIIEDFNLKCEQKLAVGQTSAVVLDNGIEIQAVTKTGDLVVNAGLQQCINLIIGTSSTRWSHFGISIGSTPAPAVTNTALNAENVAYRLSLAWNEAVGMRMFFGAISRQTDDITPSLVGEMGVYNGSAAGAVLLNRSLFLSNAPKIDATGDGSSGVYAAPMVVSAVIEFCPVA
jgi:hypothetical protein